MQALASDRSNVRYLAGSAFPENLKVISVWEEAVAFSERVLVSVPSHAFRDILQQIRVAKESTLTDLQLAWATKGFELSTGLLPHQIVQHVLPECQRMAVVSGPTFALEVGAGLPTAITVAGSDEAWTATMADCLRTKNFIAYTSTDIIGVEIGGAVKNALAIGAGLSDGLGFGANARIALINRGLRELTRLGKAMGAKDETFVGLAGMGDLVLTCTDNQSRNRRMGLALAAGKSIEEASEEIGQVVEGIGAARAVYEQAKRLDIRMPIIEQIYRVVVEGVSAHEAVEALLAREQGSGAEHSSM
jgi:glycerol-3-phosphate dehydrogenase (NAD(P)+)